MDRTICAIGDNAMKEWGRQRAIYAG